MITSGAFSYINVLDKAADASWLREATITNNLANVDTPGLQRAFRRAGVVLHHSQGFTPHAYVSMLHISFSFSSYLLLLYFFWSIAFFTSTSVIYG